MPNELREKIAKELYSRYDRHCQYAEGTWKDFIPAADSILSLIESERCVWTYDSEREWVTSCGNEVLDEATYGQYPFCPCCGKRVEVKDA